MPQRRPEHPAEGGFPIPTRFRGAELNQLDRTADRLGIRRSTLIHRATLAFAGLIAPGGESVPPTETPNAETPR